MTVPDYSLVFQSRVEDSPALKNIICLTTVWNRVRSFLSYDPAV